MRLATRVLRGLSFLATLGLIPAVANAEDPTTVYTRSWTTCSAGAVKSCHSVTLQTIGNFTGNTRNGTSVVLTVRNLQGTHVADNMAWSALSQINLYRQGTLGATSGTSTPGIGTSLSGGSPASWSWLTQTAATTWGQLRFTGAAGSRIGGCAVGTGNGMWTCPGQVVFSISTSEIFNANQFSELRLTWGGPVGASGSCSTELVRSATAGGCDSELTQMTTTVTPEPITMALLGTGLLGVGGARLRRRSKEEV